MNGERRCVKIVIGRKAALGLLAVALFGVLAATLSSQQLSMTATYPIPAGVYNQIVTTGDSGTTPADTILNSKAGNTILVPPTNASGRVGIGTATPGATPIHLPAGPQQSVVGILDVNGLIATEGYRFIINGYDAANMFWFKAGEGINRSSGEPGTAFFGINRASNGSGVQAVTLTTKGNPGAGLTVANNTSWMGGDCAATMSEPSGGECIYLESFPFYNSGDGPHGVPLLQGKYEFATDYLTTSQDLTIGGNATIRGSITAAGMITSNYSDARLKKNIDPITGALETLAGLPPVRYEWKEEFAAEKNLDRDTHWGLLAQDVEKVLPQLVSQDEDGHKRVTYGPEMNMLALAAIRELKEKSDGQQAELESLKAELKALQEKK